MSVHFLDASIWKIKTPCTFVTDRVVDQWSGFDELFDGLSRWLQDTEAKVKKHSELQGSLEDKQNLLYKHKDLHEEVKF